MPMPLSRKMIVIFCGTLLPLSHAQNKSAPSEFCDSGLKTDSSSNGYKPRDGNRCEGYYIQPVAGGRLEIESFTQGGGISLANQTQLSMKWQSPGKEEVQIRAYSLTPKEYYRMDTTRPGGDRTFVWPVELPASRKLAIGLVAQTKSDVGPSKQTVYVPLSIANAGSSSTLRIVLMPSVDASDVFVTLSPVDATGTKKTPLKKSEAMDSGPYSAWKPIAYDLKSLAAGLYYAEFSATWESGGSGTARMYFYNPPAGP